MTKIDLAALKARMAEKAAGTQVGTNVQNVQNVTPVTSAPAPAPTPEKVAATLPALSSQSTSNSAGSFSSSQVALDITAKLYADAAAISTDNKPAADIGDDFLAQLDAQKLHEKIEQLDSMLKQEHPGYASLLRDIHQVLTKQPDNVTLLADEEVGVIVSAAVRQSGVQISAKTAAKKTKSTAGLKGLSLSDIGF